MTDDYIFMFCINIYCFAIAKNDEMPRIKVPTSTSSHARGSKVKRKRAVNRTNTVFLKIPRVSKTTK